MLVSMQWGKEGNKKLFEFFDLSLLLFAARRLGWWTKGVGRTGPALSGEYGCRNAAAELSSGPKIERQAGAHTPGNLGRQTAHAQDTHAGRQQLSCGRPGGLGRVVVVVVVLLLVRAAPPSSPEERARRKRTLSVWLFVGVSFSLFPSPSVTSENSDRIESNRIISLCLSLAHSLGCAPFAPLWPGFFASGQRLPLSRLSCRGVRDELGTQSRPSRGPHQLTPAAAGRKPGRVRRVARAVRLWPALPARSLVSLSGGPTSRAGLDGRRIRQTNSGRRPRRALGGPESRSARLRPATNGELRTGTDQGNPTV